MQAIHLPQRDVISLTGEDVRPFLQSLVSNDVMKLAQTQAMFTALLTPQGKYLTDFFLIQKDEALLLDIERHRRDELMTLLQKYKLRARVKLETAEDWHVIAVIGDAEIKTLDHGIAFVDPRYAPLGVRLLVKRDHAEAALRTYSIAALEPFEVYDAHRIALGIPDGSRDLLVGKSTLLECGYEELNGVDFAKGCYVGQEVTARMKYKAAVKRFVFCAKLQSGNMPESGTKLMLQGQEIGELRSSSGDKAIALAKGEAVQRAQNEKIYFQAGDAELELSLPPWSMREFIPVARDA